jgi:hypothetical protein
MNLQKTNALCFVSLLVGVCLFAGCTETPDGDPAGSGTSTQASTEPAADTCSGWWCTAHAVPEAECSMCNNKVAAQAKEDGDWCAEHDRAASQCFVCNPAAKAKFAALYKAKFDEEPPKP